jgi:putative ABC transport system permease protein
MRFFAWLALRELWLRRGRSLLSLLALSLSVGLVVATGSIGALMQASVATPAPLTARSADLWISSAYDADYDLPAGLAAQVEVVPGVAEVQPVLRRPLRVLTSPVSGSTTPTPDTLTLLGVEPVSYYDFHGLSLAAGELPSAEAPGVVALAPWAFVRELSLGQPVTVTTPGGDVALPLVGLLEVENLAAAQQGLVLYAPLPTVAALFDAHDLVTTLEVRLSLDASPRRVQAELEQALGPAYAVSTTSQPGQRAQLWQRLVMGALFFVDGLVLLGSVFLIYAVFSAAARSRRQQIGLLRATGAVKSQVWTLLMLETIVLGLAGCGLGLLLGALFAWVGAGRVLEGTDVPAVPPLPIGTIALAVFLGMLGSLVGAIGPALRAARQPPLVALYGAPAQPAWHSDTRNLWQILARLMHPFPAEVRLAAANLSRERKRAMIIVTTLALILTMALGNVGALSLLGEELTAPLGRLMGGDYLVLPGLTTISLRELAGQDTSDVPPLSPSLLESLEDLGDQVWLMSGTTADVEVLQIFPGQPTILLDIEGYAQMGSFRFQAGDWPGALEAFRRGPAVLLAPVVARRLNTGTGDTVTMDTLQGPVDFHVAGIGNSEFTTCVLDLDDGATFLGANEVNAVMVQIRPDTDAEEVRRALLDAVQTHGGTFLPLSQAQVQLQDVFRQARLSIGLLVAITGLVAGLGIVNVVLSMVAERRQEIGLLRAVGATRPQIGRLVLAEMAMLGTVAALFGTALGWAVTFLFLSVARGTLGFAGEGTSSPAAWLSLIVASAIGLALWPLLAMLGGLVPALHAARLPVVQALKEITPG